MNTIPPSIVEPASSHTILFTPPKVAGRLFKPYYPPPPPPPPAPLSSYWSLLSLLSVLPAGSASEDVLTPPSPLP